MHSISKASVVMPGLFGSKYFFLWDPLEDDYKHSKMKFFFKDRIFSNLLGSSNKFLKAGLGKNLQYRLKITSFCFYV